MRYAYSVYSLTHFQLMSLCFFLICMSLLQEPVAAVVIMACNRPDYLERTVKSVLKYAKGLYFCVVIFKFHNKIFIS